MEEIPNMTIITEEKKEVLRPRQKAGIRLCMFGLVGVLVLFMIITATGSPIRELAKFGAGNIEATLIYQILIYTPVFVIVSLVLKRLR
jgi:hypothetical protein